MDQTGPWMMVAIALLAWIRYEIGRAQSRKNGRSEPSNRTLLEHMSRHGDHERASNERIVEGLREMVDQVKEQTHVTHELGTEMGKLCTKIDERLPRMR